jgi:hypothetical protein
MSFEFPKLKAYENGTFEIINDNGWVRKLGDPDIVHPTMTSVFRHGNTAAELIITCARFEDGETVMAVCTYPLDDVYYVHQSLRRDPNLDAELAAEAGLDLDLTYTVSECLKELHDQVTS